MHASSRQCHRYFIVLALLFSIRGIEAQDPPADLMADFDGDATVGFGDFILFAGGFGQLSSDPNFDSRFDLNGDGDIDGRDHFLFADAFGQLAPIPFPVDAPGPNGEVAVHSDIVGNSLEISATGVQASTGVIIRLEADPAVATVSSVTFPPEWNGMPALTRGSTVTVSGASLGVQSPLSGDILLATIHVTGDPTQVFPIEVVMRGPNPGERDVQIFLEGPPSEPPPDDGGIPIDILADFDDSGVVDFDDYFIFADAWDRLPGDAAYNSDADLDGDSEIDGRDFMLFGEAFGGVPPIPFPTFGPGPNGGASADMDVVNGQLEISVTGLQDARGAFIRMEADPSVVQFPSVTFVDGWIGLTPLLRDTTVELAALTFGTGLSGDHVLATVPITGDASQIVPIEIVIRGPNPGERDILFFGDLPPLDPADPVDPVDPGDLPPPPTDGVGNIALDLDLAPGDQGLRNASVSVGDIVEIDIVATAGAAGRVGIEVRLTYPLQELRFVEFVPGDILAGAIVLPGDSGAPGEAVLSSALLSGTTSLDSGLLATARFEILPAFSGGSGVAIVSGVFADNSSTQVPIGFTQTGRSVSFGDGPTDPAGPDDPVDPGDPGDLPPPPTDGVGNIVLDLNRASGDQGLRNGTTSVGDIIEIDLVATAGAAGWIGAEVKLRYAPLQLHFLEFVVGDVFAGGFLLPEDTPIPGEAVFLPALIPGPTTLDSGLLGTARFEVLPDFEGEAEVAIIQGFFIDAISAQFIGFTQTGRTVSFVEGPGDPSLFPDLDGDGSVAFSDFVTIIGLMGTSSDDPGFNPDADLEPDGRIDGLDLLWFGPEFGRAESRPLPSSGPGPQW